MIPVPDWENAVVVSHTRNSGTLDYTAPSSGFICLTDRISSGGAVNYLVNGFQVGSGGHYVNTSNGWVVSDHSFPVQKGDVVTSTTLSNNAAVTYMVFIPYKLVKFE